MKNCHISPAMGNLSGAEIKNLPQSAETLAGAAKQTAAKQQTAYKKTAVQKTAEKQAAKTQRAEKNRQKTAQNSLQKVQKDLRKTQRAAQKQQISAQKRQKKELVRLQKAALQQKIRAERQKIEEQRKKTQEQRRKIKEERKKREEEKRRGFFFRPLPRLFRGKGLICRITAQGEKDEILLSRLSAQKIALLSMKKAGEKTVIEVCAEDRVKVIAILRGLCYTILKTNTRGILAPLYLAAKRPGILLGIALFLAFSYAAKPLVLSVEYEGGAAYLQEEVAAVLRENGVEPFRFAEKSTLKRAEKQALASFRVLNRVSVEKRGFVVTVTLEADPLPVETEKPPKIVTDRAGTVRRITVLRGKAEVSAGDEVQPGAVLISGVLTGKEEEKESFAAGEVVLSCKFYEEFAGGDLMGNSGAPNADYLALLRLNAVRSMGAEEVEADLSRIEERDGKYTYVIEFTYVFTVRGGY